MAIQEEKISAIQHILKAEYNSTRWKAFLSELFTSSNFFSSPTELLGINESVASKAQHIGNIKVNNKNGISSTIAVYEVKLAENVVLERNRVGLRNLLKPYWKQQEAAFIVYYHPQAKSWRFSYVSELGEFTDTGYVTSSTEPKRYTYVLGENESCRTAAIQFSKLQDKASNATLDDIKEAFSVEKMSKEFFDTYKDHYQDFVQFLTGKRLEKVSGKWEEVVKHAPNTQLITIFNNNEKDVRDFCKKLLGRIVFLYFIQKKGWLGVPLHDKWGNGKPDFISRLLANCRNPSIFYSEYLSKLFFETLNQPRPDDLAEIIPGEKTRIPYLNGGLFEEDDANQRSLVFEAELFKDLFAFFDQYNFTIYEDDPNDHTVAVDPEMLGHIFENLLEDNKDKGAFYTPKEIVHYMCQESLIEYLTTWFEGKNYQVKQDTFISFDNAQQASFLSANEGRTGQGVLEIAQPAKATGKIINRSLIEKLLKKQLSEDDKKAVIEHAAEFNDALDKVKICDPAIGSGAFPMGLLLEIFTAKQTIHSFTHGDLTTFEHAKVKLNIIQNSIYGVDIERGAVDIARLRFWLSLVVDEPEPQPLPNLDYKIVVGNSLISKLGDDVIEIDWDIKPINHGLFGAEEAKSIENILTQLTNLQKAFFSPNSPKKALVPKIRDLKIDLLIQQLNLMISSGQSESRVSSKNNRITAKTEHDLKVEGYKSQINKLKSLKLHPEKPLEFFDWQLNFAEILNAEVAQNCNVGFDIVIGNPPYGVSIKDEYRKSVVNYLGKVPDYEIYYYFIEISRSLLKYSGVKSYIIPNTFLFNVFAENYRQKLINNWSIKCIVDCTAFKIFETATVFNAITFFTKKLDNIETNEVGYKFTANASSFQELSSRSTMYLSTNAVLSNNINWGLLFKLGNSTLKIISKIKESSLILNDLFPEYSQGLIAYDKYQGQSKETIKNRIYHYDNKEHSGLKKFLWGEDVTKYCVNWNGKEWIDYCNGIANPRQPKFFKGNRILIREITNPTIFAALTDEELYHDPSVIVILDNDSGGAKFLLGFLNSRLASFYHFNSSPKATKGGFPKILVTDIKNFPIPKVTEAKQQPFIKLVNEILTFKATGLDTFELERRIDCMVYKFYELTLEEVKIIDPDFSLTEAEYSAIII